MTSCALLLGTSGARATEPSPLPPRNLCEVVADAKSHGRTVVVRGQYYRGFEKSYLADPACKERVWVSWSNQADTERETARRMRAWRGVGGMPVVVEGVFHSTVEGGRRGYGHLGAYPAMIEVGAVLEAGQPPAK